MMTQQTGDSAIVPTMMAVTCLCASIYLGMIVRRSLPEGGLYYHYH